MAGLTAARALHDAGWKVVVVEGRDRLGGRTFTANFGGGRADLGGAWIHGATNNPVADYADAIGLRRTPHDLDPGWIYDAIDGRSVDDDELLALLRTVERFERDAWSLEIANDPEASASDLIEAYLDTRSVSGAARERARFVLELVLSASSGPIDELSPWLWIHSEEDPTRGGDEVIEGGYGVVVERLAAGLEIRTGAPVRAIRRAEDGVEVQLEGETVVGSHVIVTVPLGVLQAGSIEFEPPLPPAKRDAIARTGFGSFEKIVLAWDEPWWGDESFDLLYYAGTGGARRFSSWFDMSAPTGVPTLACLYSGRWAQVAQDTMTDAQLVERALAVLSEAAGVQLPAPTDSVVTRWSSDPFARGSYSYAKLGQQPRDVGVLAEPVDGRVLFAGEATDAASPATVHGAFRSGLREAQRIDPTATVPGSRARRRAAVTPRGDRTPARVATARAPIRRGRGI